MSGSGGAGAGGSGDSGDSTGYGNSVSQGIANAAPGVSFGTNAAADNGAVSVGFGNDSAPSNGFGQSTGSYGGTGYGGVGSSSPTGMNTPAVTAILNALAQQRGQGIAGFGAPAGEVGNVGVPPGILSGVSTAISPVTVSPLGPPPYGQNSTSPNANQMAQLRSALAALYGGSAAPSYGGGAGLGGGSSTAQGTNASPALGYGSAGFGGGSSVGQGSPAAAPAVAQQQYASPAQQQYARNVQQHQQQQQTPAAPSPHSQLAAIMAAATQGQPIGRAAYRR